MLLSIIIPIYNSEKYLFNCLESIVTQTFRDYELILIDDGSQDRSGEICDYYAEKYTNIIVKHIANGGPSKARNVGISIANGEYIEFVDSDDELKTGALETIAESVKNNGYPSLVVFEAEILDGNKQVLGYERLPDHGRVEIQQQLSNLSAHSKGCILHYIWNRWYTREIILKNQIAFDINLHLGEDFVFNCEYMKHCDMAVFEKTPFYCYFKRDNGSLTGHFRENELKRRRIMFQVLCELYQRHGILDKSMEQLEMMEANIALISMRSVGYKACTLNRKEKKEFLKSFMESEYSGYIQKAMHAKSLERFNGICAELLIRKWYDPFLLLLEFHK